MIINDGHLTDFEQRIMHMLLDGEDPVLAMLREQFAHARVEAKKFTGVGFYIYFIIPEQVERLHGRQDFAFGDVEGRSPSGQSELGFLLFITDGALATLEGYTYSDEWPDNASEFPLHYSGDHHDLDKLRKSWSA